MHTIFHLYITILFIIPVWADGQDMVTPFDDFAYAIEHEDEEEQVQKALYNFQQETHIPFRIVTLFAESQYEYSVQENLQYWLDRQSKGIFLLLMVSQNAHTYVSTAIQTTASVASLLSISERRHIQDLVEAIYTGHAIPSDGCNRALLSAIQAISDALHTHDYSLNAIIREELLKLQESNRIASDSLRKKVAAASEALERVIQKGYFYPPRIKGPHDEFIGEGMSRYAAPVIRSQDTRAQMEPIMLELDSVRNALFWADHSLQLSLHRKEWIENTLSPSAFSIFAQSVHEQWKTAPLPSEAELRRAVVSYIQSAMPTSSKP